MNSIEQALEQTTDEFKYYWKTVIEPHLEEKFRISKWNENQKINITQATFKHFQEVFAHLCENERKGFKLFTEKYAHHGWKEIMHTPVPLNQTEIFSLLSFDEQQQQQYIHTSQSIESIQEDQTIFPFFYCGPTPVYEIYSKEYITELAKELFSLCEQKYAENILEEKKQEPIYILEAGCGDCRLSLYLYNELKNILQKENQKINVMFYCCDNLSDEIDVLPIIRHYAKNGFPEGLQFLPFPVEEVIDKIKPAVVLSSWMPLGQDWTKKWKEKTFISAYILIGPQNAIGTRETFSKDERFEQKMLSFSKLQISRCGIGNSETRIFSRISKNNCFKMFAKMKEAKILFGKKLFKEAEDEYYASGIFFHDLIQKDKFFARKCTRNFLNCSICCLKQAEKSTSTDEQIKLIEKSLFCSQECYHHFEENYQKVTYLWAKGIRMLTEKRLSAIDSKTHFIPTTHCKVKRLNFNLLSQNEAVEIAIKLLERLFEETKDSLTKKELESLKKIAIIIN